MKITKAEVVWTPVQHRSSVGTIRIERRGYKTRRISKGLFNLDRQPAIKKSWLSHLGGGNKKKGRKCRRSKTSE